MKKFFITISGVLVLLIIANIFIVSSISKRCISFIPSDVTNYLYSYLNECSKTPEDAVAYTHFENETDRQLYIEAANIIVDYEILGAEKINEDLYVFSMHIERNFSTYPKRYYFVGRIDGALKIMVSIGNVPKELQEGLDVERYTLSVEELQPVD